MNKDRVLALKYDLERTRSLEEFHRLVMEYQNNSLLVLPRVLYKGEIPEAYQMGDIEEVDNIKDAHLYSSRIKGTDSHAPVLDIDFPARLFPSSSPEHFHLFLERAMDWDCYEGLLWALAEYGVIEENYAKHSVKARSSFVRIPGVVKKKRK